MQVTDQMNRIIQLDLPPRRIISIVPSQSELLWDLGLQNELVGITKFCVHPDTMYRTIARVGGTKELDLDSIRRLAPDLIIANKEENEQEQIEALGKQYPVWISDIQTLEDALDMIARVGELTNRKSKADQMVAAITKRHKAFVHFTALHIKSEKKVAYLIWKKPYMAAGKNTFIDNLLKGCSMKNIFSSEESRYPEVTSQMMAERKPDLVLLSSEPYPFREKHVDELKTALPDAKILLVDGEMFSWYGSRLLQSFDYLEDLMRSSIA